jgi:coproporphyrinogen III oxidase-like Fe-S oxidoreductase
MLSGSFEDFFRHAPSTLNLSSIHREWSSLVDHYDVERWQLPLPLWAQRAYTDSGARAWQVVREDLSNLDPQRPLCIYLHIPFCSSKCGFCDSYSFKLGAHKNEHIESYVKHLCEELRLWSRQGNLRQRPISTVHLGGGTPAFLGESAFRRLMECCRVNFAVSPETEWALETTVESLVPSTIGTLHDLGFRRLHLGIQSMQDTVRKTIGRRCSAGQAIQVIETVGAMGWITSVDLICGLPGQTLEGFLGGINRLIECGVNGFSLYELLIRLQNYHWSVRQGLTNRSHLPNYFMMHAGANLLEARGFHKNLFNHWADDRDQNIYFTFPTREEDCLAIGTIADGVFGDYHYRHPRYAEYLTLSNSQSAGLEGGLRRNALEIQLQPLTTAILSSHIPPALLPALQRLDFSGVSLLDHWVSHALVQIEASGGFCLTTNGTWFTGNMINELKTCMQHNDEH